MTGEKRDDLGKVEVSKEAISTIAGATAVRCYGIVGMAPRGIQQGVFEILGRDRLGQGVQVEVSEDKAQIDLWIVVSYGIRIPEVARNLMESVRYEVENLTGISVIAVNINVVGVKIYQ